MNFALNFRLGIIAVISLLSFTANAALLNVQPESPTIDFSGSGVISYHAASGEVEIIGAPSTFFSVDPFIYSVIQPASNLIEKNLSIRLSVDNTGSLLPSATATPGLVITGSIDLNNDGIIDHSGALLTADVLNFGFMNGPANGDDVFDLIMQPTGGELLDHYLGYQLIARVISENSSLYSLPFRGSFSEDWQGQAKGVIGSAPVNSVPAPVTEPAAIWLIVCAWFSSLVWLKPKH